MIGYIDGIGLDRADISPEDMLDLGVCYQGMPGCRKRGGFIPLEQISLEDTDPLYREMVEHNMLCEDPDLSIASFDEIVQEDENETEHPDHNILSITEEIQANPWTPTELDLIDQQVDRLHHTLIAREAKKSYDCGSWAHRRRIDNPVRENRRRNPPTRQLLIQEDPPLL